MPGKPTRFAVLWDAERGESVPVGLVVERPSYVRVFLPTEYGVPTRYEDEFRVFGPDGSDIIYRPGDVGYFDQVLVDLSRVFAIAGQGVRDDLDESAAVMELFLTHVVHPRTTRVAGEYEAGRSRRTSPGRAQPYAGNGAGRKERAPHRLLPRAA